MNEDERAAIAKALEDLSEMTHDLFAQQTAQRAVMTLLIRHLQRQGQIQLGVLVQDIQTLTQTFDDEDVKSVISEIEGVLRLLDKQTSKPR